MLSRRRRPPGPDIAGSPAPSAVVDVRALLLGEEEAANAIAAAIVVTVSVVIALWGPIEMASVVAVVELSAAAVTAAEMVELIKVAEVAGALVVEDKDERKFAASAMS